MQDTPIALQLPRAKRSSISPSMGRAELFQIAQIKPNRLFHISLILVSSCTIHPRATDSTHSQILNLMRPAGQNVCSLVYRGCKSHELLQQRMSFFLLPGSHKAKFSMLSTILASFGESTG